jgi:serine/threonine-protein kinase
MIPTAFVDASMTALPARIGRYEIIAPLASGGMAEVLLGRLSGPSGFERVVAIKRILPHLAREPSFVTMFLDEARIVAQLRHPNVVQVSELARDGDELFLVMEYLEGETASTVLRDGAARATPLAPALAAYVVAEACAGLDAAHELRSSSGEALNVVHRDVSPQNVFVGYGGEVKVIDFGIAKGQGRESRTRTGLLKGKFMYMSPEQVRGEPLDRRTDVFALGAVLWELLAGYSLFSRATDPAVIHAVLEEPIPPPSQLHAAVPAELDRICRRALERSANGRYASAALLRADLMKLIAAEGVTDPQALLRARMEEAFFDRIDLKREMLRRVRAGETGVGAPPSEPQGLEELLPATTVERTRRAQKRSWPWAVAATGALALGGAFVGRQLLETRPATAPVPIEAVAPARVAAPSPVVDAPTEPEPTASPVEEPAAANVQPTPPPAHKARPAKTHPVKAEPAAVAKPAPAEPAQRPADGFTHWE